MCGKGGAVTLFSEHSDVYSETLPPSGMTRNGELFELSLIHISEPTRPY